MQTFPKKVRGKTQMYKSTEKFQCRRSIYVSGSVYSSYASEPNTQPQKMLCRDCGPSACLASVPPSFSRRAKAYTSQDSLVAKFRQDMT